MADNEDPFAEFEARLKKLPSTPTLNQGAPTRSPYGSSSAYFEPHYQNMGPARRAKAGLQNIVSGMPIIGNLPGFRNISTPEDVEISRGARPGLSAIESATGHTAPYAVLGSGIPRLFSTLPRSAGMGAGIESTDAAMRGENPIVAGAAGAAGALPGYLLGKTITPRTRDIALENQTNSQVGSLNQMADLLRRATGRTKSGQFTKKLAPGEAEAAVEDILNPAAQIPPIPNYAARLEQMARWGASGGMAGMAFGRPIEGAIIGAIAPPAIRALGRAGNAGRETANRMLATPLGRRVAARGRDYLNNTAMSDEMRALLHAISTPISMESPQLRQTLGGE